MDSKVIDLKAERLGKCYDSFHETYGLIGDMPIIALSFTELVKELVTIKGENNYVYGFIYVFKKKTRRRKKK